MKQLHLQKKVFIILIFILLLCTTGCQGREEKPISKSSFILDTIVTITLYDSTDMSLIDNSFRIIKDYENNLSKTIQSSELYKINHRNTEPVTIALSEDTARVIEKGLYYSKISNGGFDITIAPLSSLWDFTSQSPIIPEDSQIETALEAVDYQNITLLGNQLTFHSTNTQIDLGGIAKGFIADKIKSLLMEQGIKSALINLGGNLLCIGKKPDGSPFHVGLQKPFDDRNETIATMKIEDLSVVSSGVYERNFFKDSTNYHHLLNPKTGYPYVNGLVSVTIISPESVDGDGLSTACFALGLTDGIDLLNSMDGIYGIFITDDYQIHYSKGAETFIE